ncbi:DoxX family protein [Streptomyces sp. G-5]|uniref:DoxX family protein n=1 Tax=Streptomyces sp. G-5 TaxID=2977231 RepID=UPI0021CEACA1|nr:DoxX family protein [Streptomyces sp. G-5]MCU4748178.1 DoxX family protein [Streptomyces sp. G-5]
MDILVLIGRILFALLFLGSAFNHLSQSRAMAGYVESKGLPSGENLVRGSGILMPLGALSVAFGIWADLGALLLVVFLVPTAFLMHAFWKESDPGTRQNEMTQFLKDISLAGAALALLGLFAIAGHKVGLTFTGPLFG